MKLKSHWIALIVVVLASFALLVFEKSQLDHSRPPIPAQVVTDDGRVVTRAAEIRLGQEVWQSLGGQQVGSIWGHGAYVAPDWTADYLHREATAMLDAYATREGARFDAMPAETRAALRERLRLALRTNRYDAATDTARIPAERAAAFEANAEHYASVFRDGVEAYAIPRGALTDPTRLHAMSAFFFWTSWAASTQRPGAVDTYTMNWPHEPLAGNEAPSGAMGWSMMSVVLLLAAIAALVWHHARGADEPSPEVPLRDPIRAIAVTPSQRATFKYFAVVAALLVLQVVLGAITAHYGVEGWSFYGYDLSRVLPYAVTRTWHTQLGVFWIATAWLATGLWLAPLIGGHEPKYQRAGVNVLFGALIVVVLGALGGTWASVQQRLGNDLWYWLGHQGYEYVELGRVFQIGLFIGLLLWLVLMVRAMRPAFSRADDRRPLLVLLVISTVAIALFYGAGFMYGRGSHLSDVEYWRWWVVHLWVEGFFEVFATAAISYLLVTLGLLDARRAAPAVLFATTVFLGGGVLGTMHHLYFTGSPQSFLALGAVFSALEVAPLTIVGFEVLQHLKLLETRPWVARYRWPVYFFVAVAFWNLVGAGLFGFLINPPIALYYMQGLNLTPVHGHTALFGVYGMLGLGLALFVLRALDPEAVWNERPIKVGFWALNAGLVAMVLLSMLPIGVIQAIGAVDHGTWWARSTELLHSPLVRALKWMRAPGDTLFGVGALSVAWFIVRASIDVARGRARTPAPSLDDAEVDPAPAE